MKPETFRKLAAAGLSHEQISIVFEVIADMQREHADAEEARKAGGRNRMRKWRGRLDVKPSEWDVISLAVRKRDGNVCAYCGETEGPMHCDHVVPLSQGGLSTADNLVTACRACNGGKSGRTLEEWLR